ncbi:putative flavoprotein involved in K+ transport [Nocardioides sp. BE266]|uniref:flavin-containing monooxygenase n=1 Tax=Nocardioides sp. BE266 TaxID=2817725 RepID=UPI00285930CC|nr:NAD(P)/FAD-dependent oxidoreductase [Nocardioides sp. BE266]MDR7251382.1 putative flavoprotein involved in K+ transport [Nocardioides sp. BE266]
MTTIDTVVVGAGHAGLAVSRLLTDAGREHVVLDRGRIANRWRTERWDSLHLLTPSWMTRLPGWSYTGSDPDGYLSVGSFVGYLEAYAASFGAPVVDGATVHEVAAVPGASPARRYRVVTSRGTWHARHVVIATGPHGTPNVPTGLGGLDTSRVDLLTSNNYRNPARLAAGGVLVVGASASGLQIADELSRAGRDVTIAVGRHTRMPRRHRGLDIFWWLESTGRLARTIDDVPDPLAARGETSLQLVGRNDPERATQDLDLGRLQARGVRLVGRVEAIEGRTARLRDDLAGTVGAADAALHRFLDSLDRFVDRAGLGHHLWDAPRPRPVAVGPAPERLDLRAEGIGTVLVAAGYRPHHPWLRLPITDADGTIRQRRGVTPAEGVYVVGQRFQHRRDSGYIDGARHDAHAIVGHLLASSGSATPEPVGAGRREPAA